MSVHVTRLKRDEAPKSRGHHSSLMKRPMYPEKMLFQPADIAAQTDGFDLCTPGGTTGDAMLQMQNPALLAIRNRTAKGKRPAVKSPAVKNRVPDVGQATLLRKRPLTALKDPVVPVLENSRKQREADKQTIAFKDDPVAYFAKRKDGRGHRFIYMVHRMDRDDPDFSPYELMKVPFAEIKGDYFTMSATGVTYVCRDGSTETVSLDHWADETSKFNTIRRLNVFAHFAFWKPFRIWRNFVTIRRFGNTDTKVVDHPFYRNPKFFSRAMLIYDIRNKSRAFLHKHLLTLDSQSKFRLNEFEEAKKKNMEMLRTEYDKFMGDMKDEIMGLYVDISDPKLVQVRDGELKAVRRRNPNLAQLMFVEKKKAYRRVAKTEAVNEEIVSIGRFVQLVDYMILEALADGCVECWKLAEEDIVADGAAVFQVEVSYDSEGKVVFNPGLEELLSTVSGSLQESLKILSDFPRIVTQRELRPFLRDCKLSVDDLTNKGPNLLQIVKCSDVFATIEKHILDIVSSSYVTAFQFSQGFGEFYPIYRLGQTWNVRDYLFIASGEKYEGDLADHLQEGQEEDDFLLHPELEPTVDFDKLAKDIEKFRTDVKDIENLRAGAVKGALHVDARSLKAELAPIPQRALTELQEILSSLVQMKIDKVSRVLKYYGRHLKQEPKTLEDYVGFCQIFKRTNEVTPEIVKHIEFVDRMFALFEECGFSMVHNTNPLRGAFAAFKTSQSIAQTTRDTLVNNFTDALKSAISEMEKKINRFYEKITTVPTSLKDADIETRLPAAEKLLGKIRGIDARVQQLLVFQNVMGLKTSEFGAYKDVVTTAEFTVKLYEAIQKWESVNMIMTSKPFSSIDMEAFKTDVTTLKEAVDKLQTDAPNNYPILTELVSKISDIVPYVRELELLSQGKMQPRHWNLLFELCERQSSYHPEITIEELLKLGILTAKEKIEKITSTSQGESNVETEFNEISNHWKKVQMPFQDTQMKTEDSLLLGRTAPLIQEIQDTLRSLARMAALPYVQGIREAISSMASTLENLCQIIAAWETFQGNWVLLCSLFASEEARSVLPHQANRFSGVHRKWTAIARHSLKDTHLLAVCSYPSLLDILNENNASMESILSSIGKYLDAKRAAIPRLYFLSNDEVLTLITTSDFYAFNSVVAKIFMHVKHLDCHEKDGGDGAASIHNMNRLRIYGLVGEDGETLPLTKYIPCNQPIEQWMNQLIDMMRMTVRNDIITALPACENEGFVNCVLKVPAYIMVIALNIYFSREVDSCFDVFETDPKSFAKLDGVLKRRVEEMSSITMKLTPIQEAKLRTILTVILGMRDRLKAVTERLSQHSPRVDWQNSLRYSCEQNESIQLEYAGKKWEFGNEFWGKVPRFVHTKVVDKAITSVCYFWSQHQVPMLTSTAGQGKQLIAHSCASMFGAFAYTARPFPDTSEYFLSRILIGAIASGSWAIFNDIETLSHQSLCYLFDNIRLFMSSRAAGNQRITISTRLADLNKQCRILLTADANYTQCENIPPQLKSFVRPVALMPPPLGALAEIRLAADGMKECRSLSDKLASFVQAMSNIYENAGISSSTIRMIINISARASLILSKLKEDVSESMAVVIACLETFLPLGDEKRTEVLTQCLQSSFKVGSSPSDMMQKVSEVLKKLELHELKEAIDKEIADLEMGVLSSYLSERVMMLYQLLQQNAMVIIVGPTNTGKSTILNTLKNVLNNESIRTAINAKPLKVLSVFPSSDTESRMYGNIYEDLTVGSVFTYGQVHSACTNLRNCPECCKVLRFDGPLTQRLSLFLSHLVGTASDERFMTSSMDTYGIDEDYRIVIETDDLSEADPSMLSKAGILVTRSLQINSLLHLKFPTCELAQPELPFLRAHQACGNCIDQAKLSAVRKTFCEMAPAVVKRIYHTKNCICCSESTSRVFNGHIIISDIIPTYVAIMAIRSVRDSGIVLINEEHVVQIVLISFVRAYSGILEPKEIQQFDSWLRATFSVDVPSDWVGFNVSDSFWTVYPRPSLFSMRMHQGKLIPLNFSQIDGKPIYGSRSDSQPPCFIEDVSVCHGQLLPRQRTCEILLSTKQNFIIHGPPCAGKTSFLRILFNGNDKVSPIIIPASNALTSESLFTFIATHTPLVSKTVTPTLSTKNYVLVFDGLERHHTQLMEFIRMIITTQAIPLTSQNDQKVYETATLHRFSVVVTTRDYAFLPSRFTSHFAPVYFPDLSEQDAQFICGKVMTLYGYEKEQADEILKTASMVLSQFHNGTIAQDLFRLISCLCFLQERNDRNVMLSSFFAELYYVSLHQWAPSEFREKASFIFKSHCETDEEKVLIDDFLRFETLYYSSFELSKDQRLLHATLESHPQAKLAEELRYVLTIYNSNSVEKLMLRFSSHVTRQWMLLNRAISCPGRNVLLKGRTGSGRYSLTRFVANMCENDFVYIAEPTSEEVLSPMDRQSSVFAVLRDVITNAATQQKRTVIFMRANKDNREEAELIAKFISSRDILPFFNKQELEELYTKYASGRLAGFEQRQGTLRQIKNQVRINVHVVIALENDAGYTIAARGFDVMVFNSDSPEVFSRVAMEAMESEATKKVIGDGASEICKVFPLLASIARQKVPRFHPNMFYDFVDSFAHFCAADYQDLVNQKENIQNGLDFLSKLEMEAHAIDKRLDSLAPTLQRLQLDYESLQASYTTRKEAIEIRKEKLAEELKNKTEEVETLANEVKELEKRKETLLPKVGHSRSDVEKLTDNDIETIRITAADPQPSLRLLLEVLCLFLDLPPSYERSGQKLLMDPKFVTTLVSRISNNPVSPQLLANVKPYFESSDMDPEELEAIAPALRSLYDWVGGVCELAELNENLTRLKKALDEKKRSLNEYVEEMNLEITSIKQVEASLENENKTLVQSNASREALEAEYKAVDARKKNMDSIFKGIDQFTDKWQSQALEFTTKKDKLIGNSILFAFYLVFCGSLDLEERAKTMTEVQVTLKDANIESSYDDPIRSIRDRFIVANPEEHAGRFDAASFDAHHVRTTIRCPLLIDPDGIVVGLVTQTVKAKKLVIVSQNCSNLEAIIAGALTDGKTLVLLDVDDLHPIVASILPLDLITTDQNMSYEIRVGSKLVTWDPKFKLILVSTSVSPGNLPDALLSRVTVINVVTSSLESTYQSFVSTFVDFFNPDMSPKLLAAQKQEMGYRIQVDRYERDTLDILSDIVATQASNPEYDYLSDRETITDLVKSKDCYLQAISAPTRDTQATENIRDMTDPFRRHVKLCQVYWRVMSRILPLINPSAQFRFSNYQKTISAVFVNEGLHPGNLTSDQHAALQQSISAATLQFVSQSLPIRDTMFFMFISSYLLKEDAGTLRKQDLISVLDHIRTEYRQGCDFESTEAATGDTFELLKFTNVVNIFHYLSRFLATNYGKDYHTVFPYFQVDSVITNTASMPSLVIASPDVNPTSLIQSIVSLRCKHENLDVLSLNDDLDVIRTARKITTSGMNRGNWVIIHYSKPSRAAASMLTDVFTQMTTTSINTNFRLIVIASTMENLSPSMIGKSKRVNVETFPSIRNHMWQLFHHYSGSIKSSTNSKAMKKLAYACAFLLSAVKYQNFIQPTMYASEVKASDTAFKDVIEQISRIIAAQPGEILLGNLRLQLEQLIYSGVADVEDRKKLSTAIAQTLVPAIFEDDFTFAPDSKDSEKWIIPGDIPLSNFPSVIQQLPMFPSTDVLRNPGASLRNWNLSIWVSKPFIRYRNFVPTIDEKNLATRLENAKMMLPERISTAESDKFTGPIGLFLLAEVESLNSLLFYMRDEFELMIAELETGKRSQTLLEFAMGDMPRAWRNRSRQWCFTTVNGFSSYIVERHAHLTRCLQDEAPLVFDVRFIENPRAILQAYLVERAIEMHLPVGRVSYEFEFTDGEPQAVPNALMLTRMRLAYGAVESGLLTPAVDPKKSPFRPAPTIMAKVVETVQTLDEKRTFTVPMYRQALVRSMDYDPQERSVHNGQSNNFVWNIKLRTEHQPKLFQESGTALYCSVPDQLV